MNSHDASAASPGQLTRNEVQILNGRIKPGLMDSDIRRYAGIHSRHISHPDNCEAVLQLYKDLWEIGRGQFWFRPQAFEIPEGSGEIRLNVEAMLPGVGSSNVVIISAHLDSTGDRDPAYRPEIDPAPGADDDASGIGGVLAAARAIVALSRVQRRGQPRAEIRFVLFNAEEQGQRGSRVYARDQRRLGAQINAVYQMDMIGYRKRGQRGFELHAGFAKNPDVQGSSLELAHQMVQVCTAIKHPLVPQVYFHRRRHRDPGQGFSDHTSFHAQGFPAVLITEDFFPGPAPLPAEGYPNEDYHTPDDRPDTLDTVYAASIARAVTAAAWHRATRIDGCREQHTQGKHGHDGDGAGHGEDEDEEHGDHDGTESE